MLDFSLWFHFSPSSILLPSLSCHGGGSLISVFHPKLIWQVRGGILDTAEAGR